MAPTCRRTLRRAAPRRADCLGIHRRALQWALRISRRRLIVGVVVRLGLVMLKRFFIGAAASAFALASAAQAAVVTTFSFSGQGTAGQNSGSFTAFPTDGVAQVNDPQFHWASIIGQGREEPFLYLAGAATAGKASATSNVTVTLQITNDTGVESKGSLGALIFAGAVGIANPNFADPSCVRTAIESCASFLAGTPAINPGESAAVDFSATLSDGTTLFGGSILVNSTTKSATFSPGTALSGFGPDPINGNVFSWNETLLTNLSLGVFQPGETKTLTYLVASTAMTSVRCTLVAFGCPLALTGFGDPPPGSGGVIIVPSSANLSSLAASSTSANTGFPLFSVTFTPTSPIPVPGALFLFPLGIAGILGVRRLRRTTRN